MKKILVLGAGGFVGNHLATRLKQNGCYVVGIDLKFPEFNKSSCDKFIIGDLRRLDICEQNITTDFDEIYQLAADMGGAGYIFTGENDFNLMHNSAQINLNILSLAIKNNIKKIFYSSSACIYPKHNQMDPDNPTCSEQSAYPADPDSEYGWEKLFSERMYLAAAKNYNIQVRIARFHNVYGPLGVFNNGKEKAPAALCRKVAEAENNTSIDIWGNGSQTRSFLFIDDCVNGILALMQSSYGYPVNIGSEEKISINDFAKMIIRIADKNLSINNINGPVGVNGRTSDNTIANKELNWYPQTTLEQGITKTFLWIQEQVKMLATAN
ncbi:MAG: NAD-dependent epimerase/dehydratase family protein [Bacteroidetes bacterium]|nr:NAD-dependent epimerase/dehydratase family protein [Bacteroidota bacterium]